MRPMCLLVLGLIVATPAPGQVDPTLFSAMRARNIGPAGMSGRVAAVDVALSDPNVIYVGAATGGVWKSVNGGITWQPIFDDQPTASIGAVAVFQANPDIVWVGTGEGNPRNSAGVGRGMFRSIDGGVTWQALGLERSEHIHRVVLHPTDPDVAYVAALGPTWSDGEERGVFKTVDGGQTWDRVLFANARTGASDLVMDPVNPNKLFAGLWEHRRWPWFFESGGSGSGIHVTYDAGATWTRLTADHGLPDGPLGRIGLAIAASDPRVVYAIVEAEQSAIIRSDDGGRSWRTTNDGPRAAPRPFYYADIRVDPLNENRLYSLHGSITVSEDQGRTFRVVVPSSRIHGDVQELWIHPHDSRFLIMGNDGGIGLSYDRGETWRFVENLPLAQFYHVAVDTDTPFNVYGGLQDNGSWFGPSHAWFDGPIRNYDWTRTGGGDGFASLVDFGDPRYGYSMSQQGAIRRFDKVTGERKEIQPVHPDAIPLRFNWNAAFNVDPFDSTVVYLGSQFVHRTNDGGNSWETISPDLTTNDPEKQRSMESGGLTLDASGAENHTTIITIAPSPVERGVIWVGTDDGNVQLTRDAGATWTNVVDRIPDVPPHTWVPHIEPSKFDAATAFVAFDDHRRGNWTVYLYETRDYGRSWRSLAGPGLDGFVHAVEQDPVEPDLLFAGTEFGMFVSVDRGNQWWKWTHGLPTAPYRALVVHPRDHDLVLGTHGRAVFVIDDIRPLRAVTRSPRMLAEPVHLFESPPAQQHTVAESMMRGYRSTGDAMFAGENRPYGAMLTYSRGASDDETDVEITFSDANGRAVRTMTGPGTRGLNRVFWNLRLDGFTDPADPDDTVAGPEVLPGVYAVRITAGGAETTGSVTVLGEPRVQLTAAARRQKFDALLRAGGLMERTAQVTSRVRQGLQGIEAIEEALDTRGQGMSDLAATASSVEESLQSLHDRIAPRPGPGLSGSRDLLASRLRRTYSSLESSWDAPTQSQRRRLDGLDGDVDRLANDLNALLDGSFAAFRRQAAAAGLDLLPPLERIPTTTTSSP